MEYPNCPVGYKIILMYLPYQRFFHVKKLKMDPEEVFPFNDHRESDSDEEEEEPDDFEDESGSRVF